MPEPSVYLLDVNVILALLSENHIHNKVAGDWFSSTGLQWALCAFTEAGAIRLLVRSSTDELSVEETTTLMQGMKQHSGYRYQSITADWQTLTKPFSKRIHGHKQITDAYLLGLAIREGLVLTTFDRAILQMAGEHRKHVLVLEAK